MLELTQDVHKKAWTRIKWQYRNTWLQKDQLHQKLQSCTSLTGIHTGFQGQGCHQSCADTDTGKCHHSCSNGGWYGQGGWKPQQPWGYKPIPIVEAQNRPTSIQLCLPQGWQRHKADTMEQESLQEVQLNLPFKKS